ncbi:MAG TPA: hypothetical protein PK299_09905 [Anaerolineales bacterium]|nr:hypothetical protein [Anaerolineales bacterium]
MFKSTFLLSLVTICLLSVLSACSGNANQPTTAPNQVETPAESGSTPASAGTAPSVGTLVYVDSIELQVDPATPASIVALVKGNLADGCTTIGTETQQLPLGDSNVFSINLNPSRPADAMCTEALVPFERLIPLKTNTLPAGNYVLEIHGVTTEFAIP